MECGRKLYPHCMGAESRRNWGGMHVLTLEIFLFFAILCGFPNIDALTITGRECRFHRKIALPGSCSLFPVPEFFFWLFNREEQQGTAPRCYQWFYDI